MKSPRRIVGLLAAAPLLFLTGCVLESGVGDPEKATVDAQWTGFWINRDDGQLVTIVPYDDSTYLVDWMAYKGSASAPEASLRVLNKGWTTEIGGKTYATFEMLLPQRGQATRFLVAEIARDDDTVTMRQLNPKFEPFANARTPQALEAAIKTHRDKDDAFSATNVYTKSTAAESKAIRKAFHSG